MTKQKAVLMMLEIVKECQENSADEKGCRTCIFGCGNSCLASDGNTIPTDWLINDKIYELLAGKAE